jgi:hypothetical protein
MWLWWSANSVVAAPALLVADDALEKQAAKKSD